MKQTTYNLAAAAAAAVSLYLARFFSLNFTAKQQWILRDQTKAKYN